MINIVIIGTGMYVCGRATDTCGTIMPAVFEWTRTKRIGSIYVVGTDPKALAISRTLIESLQKRMGLDIDVRYFPEGKNVDPLSYKAAIKNIPHPACAIIAVPDNLHTEIAQVCIEKGLHTLVVKPLAPTMKEVDRLIKAQTKAGVYCAVEYHKRLDKANLKLRDMISHGSIGDPLYFLVEYSQRKSVPTAHFKKWIQHTNIFQYLGVHYVDLIYFVTGAVPIRAMAMGQRGWLASKGINTYDSIEAVIEWETPSGKRFASHILTNWIDPEKTSAMSDQKIKVIGTKGRYESDQKNRGIMMVTDERGIEEPNPYFCGAYGTKGAVSYHGYGIESINQFLDDVALLAQGSIDIDQLEKARPTFRESIIPTKVIEAVNRSLKYKGRWIEIRKIK